ncbi:MAG: ATP-binding cassette domain-containing protein [Acidobacteriota bacterium]|nr:ATP-binding cassette domain-containing protein [Acidobacteriota bacterium]
MIAVDGLTKRFGEVQALAGVSFQVPEGSITGLLGPNGAGKTTTLRILYTALEPDEGRATVDDFDTQRQALEVRRRIGVLPADGRGLYPRLTSRENVRYFGRLHGLQGEALEANIERLVGWLDMQDIIDRRTEGFSTGQQLKVAIARALVHDPRNVLLDEPTSGLDVMATRAMRDFVRRLRDDGRSVLFSSHVMQEVAALCDRIVIVGEGRVLSRGTPDELLETTGESSLEDAFVATLGTTEGLE